MRLSGIIDNDVVNGIDGISVSIWFQGCPHKCEGCHNQHTWDPNGGRYISLENCISCLKDLISRDGIVRNLSMLGGEPLSDQNIECAKAISESIKSIYPDIKIIVWTGYTIGELSALNKINDIASIDYLIDGRFDKDLYDPSLQLRGSKNQRIYKIRKQKTIFGRQFVDIKDITDDFS